MAQLNVFHLAAASLLGLAGCATRQVPASFPRGAPASTESPAAPAPEVGRMVTEDPPLPGEPADAWPGLATPMTSSGAHHDH